MPSSNKARKWAKDNPMTAKATGVSAAIKRLTIVENLLHEAALFIDEYATQTGQIPTFVPFLTRVEKALGENWKPMKKGR